MIDALAGVDEEGSERRNTLSRLRSHLSDVLAALGRNDEAEEKYRGPAHVTTARPGVLPESGKSTLARPELQGQAPV